MQKKKKEVSLPPEFYSLIKSLKPTEDPSKILSKKALQETLRQQLAKPLQKVYVDLLKRAFPDDGNIEDVKYRARQFSQLQTNEEKFRAIERLKKIVSNFPPVIENLPDQDEDEEQPPPLIPPEEPEQAEDEEDDEFQNPILNADPDNLLLGNPMQLDALDDNAYLQTLYNATPEALRQYARNEDIDITELPAQIDKAELAEYIMYQKRGRVPLFNPGGNPGLAGEGLFKKRGRGRPRKHPIKGAGFLDTIVDYGKKAFNYVKENPDVLKKGFEYGKKGIELGKKGIDYYKASRKAKEDKGGALMMTPRRGHSTYQSYF